MKHLVSFFFYLAIVGALPSYPIHAGVGAIYKGADSQTIIQGPDGSIIKAHAGGGLVATGLKTQAAIVSSATARASTIVQNHATNIILEPAPVVEFTKDVVGQSANIVGRSGTIATSGSRAIIAGPASTTFTGPEIEAPITHVRQSSVSISKAESITATSVVPPVLSRQGGFVTSNSVIASLTAAGGVPVAVDLRGAAVPGVGLVVTDIQSQLASNLIARSGNIRAAAQIQAQQAEIQAQQQAAAQIRVQQQTAAQIQHNYRAQDAQLEAQEHAADQIRAQQQATIEIQAREQASAQIRAQQQAEAEIRAQELAAANIRTQQRVAAAIQAQEQVEIENRAQERAAAEIQAQERAAAQIHAQQETAAKIQEQEQVAAEIRTQQRVDAEIRTQEQVAADFRAHQAVAEARAQQARLQATNNGHLSTGVTALTSARLTAGRKVAVVGGAEVTQGLVASDLGISQLVTAAPQLLTSEIGAPHLITAKIPTANLLALGLPSLQLIATHGVPTATVQVTNGLTSATSIATAQQITNVVKG